MQLISLKIENFRQYYGKQEIEFASGDKNITVIFGENGKGKTGIFRALMFCLFGSTHIGQDNKSEKIHLVNFNKIEEEKGRPIKASVEVNFKHKNKRYIIIREVIGYKRGNAIEEKISVPKLFTQDENGNFSPDPVVDDVQVKNIINSIIDEKIKDFFLFDAERIDTLAKTDIKVKEEVKTVIIKLLQIDKIDTSISILKSLYSKQKKNLIKKTSNINLKKAEEKIDTLEDQIKDYEAKIDIKIQNLIACDNEIQEIKTKLAENENIRNIQKYIKEIKSKINDKTTTLNVLRDSLKEQNFNNLHALLMKDRYVFTKDYLNQIIVEQKDIVPVEVIEKSLNDKICACCKTDLSKVSEALREVLNLKENFKRSELTPLISEINGTIAEFQNDNNVILDSMLDKLGQLKTIKESIGKLQQKIKDYNVEIKKWSEKEENLTQLDKSLESKQAKKEALNTEIKEIEIIAKNLEKALRDAQREFDELKNKDESLKYDNKKLQFIGDITEALEKIFNEYSQDMRNKLMKETSSIFKVLIDSKDEDLISEVRINGKYELELYNWSGTKITQDISQGQRQIMSLSFITALAKVAAGGAENIDFPLFMDTPFGRVSGNNRDNLIENIPKLTSQWILLLTDTEFSVSEEIKMKECNKLGKWYKLDQIKKGHTNIVPIDLSKTMATRR